MLKRILFVNLMILLIFAGASYWMEVGHSLQETAAGSRSQSGSEYRITVMGQETENEADQEEDYIRWVDFQVSEFALSEAYEYDRDTYGTDAHIGWIDLLAWTAAHTGGVFDDDRTVLKSFTELEEKVGQGESLEQMTSGLEYYAYYKEAYTAVLGGMVGEFEIEEPVEGEEGEKSWTKK